MQACRGKVAGFHLSHSGSIVATSYYYRLFDTEFGPVGFRDMVDLVREGQIGADDLTRADWEQEWRPAAEVVGLFHMAGREDLLAAWQAERERLRAIAKADQATPGLSLKDESADNDDQLPGWQRRLLDIRARNAQQAELAERASHDARSPSQLNAAIAAAASELDGRDSKRRRWLRWKTERNGPVTQAHLALRWGLTMVTANVVAFSILHWSASEERRFPVRNPQTSARVQIFPMWGNCTPEEYAFLLVDVMVVAGIAGYGTARVLELQTDG